MSETILRGDLTGPIDVSAGGDWRLVKGATVVGGADNDRLWGQAGETVTAADFDFL